MIAPWLFELLRRERDWGAMLPKIAEQLTELPEDRVRAALDLGAAFEHVEPDRYHAIRAYQLAGPGRDRGRSRVLAVEIGWWQAVGRLAQIELKSTRANEALIAACRSLVDDGKLDAATQLFADEVTAAGIDREHPDLAGLRAELEGRNGEWKTYVTKAKQQRGAAAAEMFVTAARLARADNQRDWHRHLAAALEAMPQHGVAAAMLADAAIAREDDALLFELVRLRLLGLDGYEYCDGMRGIATRLLLAEPAHHAGMGRRLIRVALERAYAAELTEIPGHLALWTLLDAAAAQDGQRTELLPLILRALDRPIPDFDRTWLAARGAEICIEAGNHDAARAYAAVIAEHAPSHPIVRELLAEASASSDSPDISNELEALAVDAALPPVEMLLPDDLELGHMESGPAAMRASTVATSSYAVRAPDPRFVDVSVPVLDDGPASPAPSVPATKASAMPPIAASAAAPPTPPAKQAVAASAEIDDQWDVDEELFRRKRPTTIRPPESAPTQPEPAPPARAAAAVAPASAPAAKTAPAAATQPASAPAAISARPAASLIPAAAMRVLQQAGAPRSLPKVPPPPNAKPRAERVTLPVDVRIEHAGAVHHVHTRDLSTSGFFAVTSVALAIGAEVGCEIRMPLPGEVGGKAFRVRAKVARRDQGGLGFALVDPSGALVEAIAAFAGTK